MILPAIEDISERKAVERALQTHAKELERSKSIEEFWLTIVKLPPGKRDET